MKHVSFRIVVLCVLLTPLCYGFTVQGLAYYLAQKYTREIKAVSIGDTALLLQGAVRLRDTIRRNIDRYLQQQSLLSWGTKASVWVTSGGNIILYPAPIDESDRSLSDESPRDIASENYSLLQGLSVSVDATIGFNTPVSYGLLSAYMAAAIVLLLFTYRAGIRKAEQEEAGLNETIVRLVAQEKDFSGRLLELQQEREHVAVEKNRLETTLEEELRKAGSNEAQLFGEIVKLDEKLSHNLQMQEQQQAEIRSLTEKIAAYEKESRPRAPRGREVDLLEKRFGAIYKRISVHDRALEGFAELTEDMKIKGEEIIHRLNEAPDLVPIKRKVFSGKGREAVWEVLFAYNGRLYFRRHSDQQIEVLAIGTKNSQQKDLEFIDKISRRSTPE